MQCRYVINWFTVGDVVAYAFGFLVLFGVLVLITLTAHSVGHQLCLYEPSAWVQFLGAYTGA